MTGDVSMHPFWETHRVISTRQFWCEPHGTIRLAVDDAAHCPLCGTQFPTEDHA